MLSKKKTTKEKGAKKCKEGPGRRTAKKGVQYADSMLSVVAEVEEIESQTDRPWTRRFRKLTSDRIAEQHLQRLGRSQVPAGRASGERNKRQVPALKGILRRKERTGGQSETSNTGKPKSSKKARKNERKTFVVDKILKKRVDKGKVKYLVSWEGYGAADNTWEPAETLAQDVPTLIQSFENTTQRLGDTKAK
eukprot:Tamp_18476.p1 GENE.Tamp_18476~~Tamp_18476.p1  ORF type:complete len:208 (-),score=36.73 Tamp_18476:698-1276(-)